MILFHFTLFWNRIHLSVAQHIGTLIEKWNGIVYAASPYGVQEYRGCCEVYMWIA
jgi:hypothetical protein